MWSSSDSYQVLAVHRGLVIHGLHDGLLYASRGYHLLVRGVEEPANAWRQIGSIPAPLWARAAAKVSLVRLGLRAGIHDVLPLPSGALLVSLSGSLVRFCDGRVSAALRYEGFRKPMRLGLLRDRSGSIYVAQYSVNIELTQAVKLWRSDDDGMTFDIVHTFPAGNLRHIHFVQEDPLDGALWLGTGDLDAEVVLLRSTDQGRSWEKVGGGGQIWRTVGLAFRPDAIYYGTDAGREETYPNRIVRLDRRSGELEELQPIEGPVHGVGTMASGDVVIATGIEGGPNEVDRCVHVWHSSDGSDWRKITRWRSGFQPHVVQYAMTHCIRGQEESDRLFLVNRGLLTMPLGSLELRLPARGSAAAGT